MEVELSAGYEPLIDEDDDYNNSHLNNNNTDDYSSFDGERCGICMDVVIDRGVLDCCQHWFCFTCIDNWATITNLCPLCQNEFQSITCVPVYDTIGSNDGDGELYSREGDWNIEGENNTLSFPSYYIDENAVICMDGDECKIRNGSVTMEDDPNLDTSIACDSCDIWYHAFCVGFDTEGTCETSWLCPRCIGNENPELPRITTHSHTLGTNNKCVHESTLSGKVSISIADAGETAVVVSIIERNGEIQRTEGSSEKLLAISGVDSDTKIEMPNSSSKMEFLKLETPSVEKNRIEIPISQAVSPTLPCISSEQTDMRTISANIKLEPCSIDGSSNLVRNINRHLDLSESSSLDVKQHVAGVSGQESTSVCTLPAGTAAPGGKDNTSVITGTKRKPSDSLDTISGNRETHSKIMIKPSKKKLRVDKHGLVNDPKNTADGCIATGSRKNISKREKEGSDIMSIVKETHNRKSEKAAGLRVKKIMRRSTEDKESSIVVQNLRQEIREAARNKSDFGENNINPELLAAFRAAISGSVSEPAKNSPALVLKAKKVILQKGKVRESLTKKIYGIGGKRKKSWTRDCEIEFWKHRCLQAGKPEKIDTLKSVLSLLRRDSDGIEVQKGEEERAKTSILSRLYLADNSVFPRKDDIKPISDLSANSIPKNVERSSVENLATSSVGNHILKTQQTSKVSTQGVKHKDKDEKCEKVGKSDDVKKDKRKWALEILARKTASTSSNGSDGKEEDDPMFKNTYPLLAQLPMDMRPVLAPSKRNNIPISVRQPQLYRLTEHFLRKANLPVIRRTADTEFAVADAVNIEKEVADKSNSRLVYTNLMSQEALHRVENTISSSAPDHIPLATLSEKSEESVEDSSNDPNVEEALKKAGFLSDSPPNSPRQQIKENREANEASKENEGEEPDNVLEVGSNPELDIYRDFEYNLEDDDFIGASSIKISNSEQEDPSKIKMVFSTFTSDKICTGHEEKVEVKAEECSHQDPKTKEGDVDISHIKCEELYGPDKEELVNKFPESEKVGFSGSSETVKDSNFVNEIYPGNALPPCVDKHSPVCSETSEHIPKEAKLVDTGTKKQPDSSSSVSKKVEGYIKEHIRPLCKSGVITVGQYRWAVEKTTEKVMKYHSKEKSAKFLIKEGDKVKKLAEQYVEASQHKKKK